MNKIILVLAFLLLFTASSVTAQTTTTAASNGCEGNFDCDGDQDGEDAATFKSDFGRSSISNPCTNENQCNGDFACDGTVDGTDGAIFKSDFGRNPYKNPCSACVRGECCTYTTTSSTTTTCAIEIIYGRPGRRGIPLTCNDIVDFTLCTDCSAFNPSCLAWTISPAVSWLSIEQTDACSWRLLIGNYCEEPDATGLYIITATDTCNDTSDTVILEFL
jgi:hypothetical protein